MIRQCALTKLAYLLSKSDRLGAEDIRKLICLPLRGEITLPPSGNTANEPLHQTKQETMEPLPNILDQIARLSAAPPPPLPVIEVSATQPWGVAPTTGHTVTPSLLARSSSLSRLAKDVTSPWSSTISETASTEAALLPFLVHLAIVRDDAAALRFCFDASDAVFSDATPLTEPPQLLFSSGHTELPQNPNVGIGGRGVVGGIVNVLDPASGRTPLHVAALNGSKKCAILLLESGALVHLRDALDHTALYYVSDPSRTLEQLTQDLLVCRRPDRGTNPSSTT